MVSFNIKRRQAIAINSRTTVKKFNNTGVGDMREMPDQEELLRQHQNSFAVGVLAASMGFRPFNPSFSRRPRPPPSNKSISASSSPTLRTVKEAGPGPQRQQKSAPKVSFAIFHDTRYTMGPGDYTYKEREATWYSPRELAVIAVDRLECLRLLELGLELDDVKFTGRGLEHLTRKGVATSARNVSLGRTVIREEQESTLCHRCTREDEVVERMAASYGAACSGCTNEAHRVALREILANQKYLMCEIEACYTPTSEVGADASTGCPHSSIASAA